jgi:hypothetical protein
MDVPYLPDEWNSIRDKAFAKDPNLNGTSVFGKYLSKMKLNQYRDKATGRQYGWADSEMLNAQRAEKQAVRDEERQKFEAEIQQRYANGEIGEAEYRTLMSTETQNAEMAVQATKNLVQNTPQDNYYTENNSIVQNQMGEMIAELTQEDKTVLAMK